MPLRAMSKLRFPCPSGLLHLSPRGWGGDGRGRPLGTSDPLRPIGSPTMPVRTPCPTAPSAAERVRLKKMAYGHKTEHGCGSVHRWCCTPRMDAPTHASPGTRRCVWIPCAADVSSSPRRARPGSETVNAAAVPPRSPRCRPPRRRALEAVHVDAEAGAVVDGGGAAACVHPGRDAEAVVLLEDYWPADPVFAGCLDSVEARATARHPRVPGGRTRRITPGG